MSINIDNAFTSAILNGGLAIDVVHDNGIYSYWSGSAYSSVNGVYTPDSNREYTEIKTFPASVVPLSLRDSDEHVGVFQAIIKYPADTGAIAAKTKAEEVLALFSMNTPLTYSGQKVFVTGKSRDGGRQEGGFYQIVVRISYRAFVTR